MNFNDAIEILNPKANDEISLKTAYRKAAKANHPDKNPDCTLDLMQMVNAAYKLLSDNIGKWDINEKTGKTTMDKQILKVWESLKDLNDIKIDLCGTWLWISGKTYEHKAAIKEAGCKWANKKKMWYWHAEQKRSKNMKEWSMDKIAGTFGKENLSFNKTLKLA